MNLRTFKDICFWVSSGVLSFLLWYFVQSWLTVQVESYTIAFIMTLCINIAVFVILFVEIYIHFNNDV